ncbi:hypothetical protein [Derxia gummosa]|uniref:DUF4124 domain-containing protein n=1 Tax=Derxia gummosa DSM 723 TaxID=1121388 RepID=A0A8B6X766_9BURK|nr:hypothetical protein [Derxia gummosa]
MTHRFFISTLLLGWLSLDANAQVVKCELPDKTIEYKNVGDTRGCKPIDLPAITTVPRSAPVSAKPANPAAAAPRGDLKIDPAVQKGRDDDRRRILEAELHVQEERLQQLRAEFNNGEPERRGDERNYQKYLDRVARLKEDIAQAEGNLTSIKRELGNLPN